MRSATTLSLRRSLLASTVAALMVWVCLLTWRPLLEQPFDYVAPLLVTAILIALVGAVARWHGVRPLAVLGLELLVVVPALLLWTVGSPFPTPAALQELVQALTRGVESANRYAAPVPVDVPPVAPLFLAAGLGAVLVVDLVALSLRRVPVTGLIVLVLHLVPINLGVQVAWWVFALVTAGFLVLLFLDQDDLVVRWGEDVQDRERGRTTRAPVAEGVGGATAARIGLLAAVGAIALTLALTTLVPQAPARQWSGGGGGDGGQISLTSPLVDMRRDLVRGLDMPLLTVNGDRKPTYVRTAVLAEFNGTEWSTGDRRATRVQAANGTPLTLNGVDGGLRRTETDYVFTATDLFRSRWLPVMSSTSAVRAEGDWRYDREMMDFASFDEEVSTSGMSWDVVGVDLDLSAVALDRAPSGLSQVDSTFTDLPRALPTSIEDLARTVAGDEPTRFRQARALQSWFRSEFSYSLDSAEAVGSNELVAFLDERGRVGYCEQFAAAMAVMARTLGIPSRVAVGFLSPDQVGPGAWEFSSYDLHAWPELYFAGAGWVRFEPTPASRASGVPDYSRDAVDPIREPSAAPTPTAAPAPTAPQPEERDRVSEPATDEVSSGPNWQRIATTSGLLALLSLLVLTPQWLRRQRRAHRLASGNAEELWAELRDSSVDLGFAWPDGRSPRALGTHVSRWSSSPEVAGTQPQETDGADVMVLVEAVERERYARADQRGAHAPSSGLAEVVTTCVAAMRANASRAARWRAQWIPVSLASRRRRG